MNARILISSNPDNLRAALANYRRVVTVEAEYGDDVVEGYVTLAHHGPRSGNQCPCLYPATDIVNFEGGAIGISHLDLDTLGGIMAVSGNRRVVVEGFWEAVAFVDTHGVHKLGQISPSESVIEGLNAVWAWLEAHRVMAPRDGSAADVTEEVAAAVQMVKDLCAELYQREDHGLLAAGRAWAEAKAKLEADSFVVAKGGVILRMADTFTNHLYEHAGTPALAVVALNTKSDSVTVSLADPIDGVDCCKLMQRLFGPLAGGHAGIAGTPRNEVFMLHDAERVMDELVMEIAVATTEVRACS